MENSPEALIGLLIKDFLHSFLFQFSVFQMSPYVLGSVKLLQTLILLLEAALVNTAIAKGLKMYKQKNTEVEKHLVCGGEGSLAGGFIRGKPEINENNDDWQIFINAHFAQ